MILRVTGNEMKINYNIYVKDSINIVCYLKSMRQKLNCTTR